MEIRELIQRAINARERAYAPYSNFCVGAALLTQDGTVYEGCNIENSAFSGTNCAERTALFKAVSEGVRAFEAIAVVGGPRGPLDGYCAPCGVCRQVLREFVAPEKFTVYLAKSPDEYRTYTLADLLPLSFGPDGNAGPEFFTSTATTD
jgi:cytidine deaminase